MARGDGSSCKGEGFIYFSTPEGITRTKHKWMGLMATKYKRNNLGGLPEDWWEILQRELSLIRT
jgi:hypothetical protein